MRGAVGYRRIPARGVEWRSGAAETAPGASKPDTTLRSAPQPLEARQPHEGQSGAGNGDPLARADPGEPEERFGP